LTQVKRILKYVNGTSDYGIMYSWSMSILHSGVKNYKI
jgi:hypothetical protein